MVSAPALKLPNIFESNSFDRTSHKRKNYAAWANYRTNPVNYCAVSKPECSDSMPFGYSTPSNTVPIG